MFVKHRVLQYGLAGLGFASFVSAPAIAQVPAPSEQPAPPASSPISPALPPPPAPAVQGPAPSLPPTTESDPAPAAPTPVPETPAPKPEEPPVPLFAAAPGKGLVVTTRDKNFQIGLRPRMQLRTQINHREVGPDELEAQVRTLRLTVSGYALTPDLKYTIQFAFGGGDFDNGSSSPIFDAFIDYTRIRDFNVRVGQYFVPFDRARTIREFALHFVDRQQVVRELTLDRDVGIMFSSADIGGLGGRLAYNVFLGGGDGRNRFADTRNPYGPQRPGFLAVARLTLRPFGAFDDDQEGDTTRTKTPKLAIGVAGAYNRSSTRQRSTTGDTYTTGAYDYKHAAADLVFKLRGFALLTEAVWRGADKASHTRIVAAPGTNVTEFSREGWGWFVQAGQMLTSRLEVVGRFEELHANKGTDPAFRRSTAGAAGRQAGGGLNLYLNGHAFKLQSDYIHVFAEKSENAQHLVRLQLDATF